MNNLPEKIPVLHVITSAPQNERGIMELIHSINEDCSHYFLFDNTKAILHTWQEWRKYEYCGLFLPNKSKLARYQFLLEAFKRADRILLHGMYFARKIYYFILHCHPEFLEKTTWIEWGADLYRWRVNETGIISRKMNQIGDNIRRAIPRTILSFPVDELYYRREYGDSAELIPLPLPATRPILPRIDEAYAEKHDDRIRIQVAHNGLMENHHMRILEAISKFRDENIQVVIPMAYNIGDLKNKIDKKAYKNAVLGYANYCFGKKAVPFTSSVALDYYMRYLWTVDIVIFDLHRPCGIGNLLYMLYMGKKVFLPADSDYYRYLTDKGIKIYDTDKIPEMTFEEFSAPPEEFDKQWLYDFFDFERNTEKWREFLQKLLEEGQSVE